MNIRDHIHVCSDGFVIVDGWEAMDAINTQFEEIDKLLSQAEEIACENGFDAALERIANLHLDDAYTWELVGFNDEYSYCCECGRHLRTSPDCYVWTPDYWETEDGLVCSECLDGHEYVNWAVDKEDPVTVNLVDPEDYGFNALDYDFEYGLHRGQNWVPKKIKGVLNDMGLDVVFTYRPSQFTTTFRAWVRVNKDKILESVLEMNVRQWPDPASNLVKALSSELPRFSRVDVSTGEVEDIEDEIMECMK